MDEIKLYPLILLQCLSLLAFHSSHYPAIMSANWTWISFSCARTVDLFVMVIPLLARHGIDFPSSFSCSPVMSDNERRLNQCSISRYALAKCNSALPLWLTFNVSIPRSSDNEDYIHCEHWDQHPKIRWFIIIITVASWLFKSINMWGLHYPTSIWTPPSSARPPPGDLNMRNFTCFIAISIISEPTMIRWCRIDI